jgi:acetyl-CoA carboxylase biotin carboxyl carrier protein
MATRRVRSAEGIEGAPVRDAGVNEQFTLDQVKALVKVIEGTEVTSLRWERNGQQVFIRRGQVAPIVQMLHDANAPLSVPAVPRAATPIAVLAPAAALVAAPTPETKPGVLVTSPFVGTFYRSPSPDSPHFVDVGAVVKKGQVLCIVEAMKLMNEIEAEAPGKIAEIFAANATPVEFGQPLFRIEPV